MPPRHDPLLAFVLVSLLATQDDHACSLGQRVDAAPHKIWRGDRCEDVFCIVLAFDVWHALLAHIEARTVKAAEANSFDVDHPAKTARDEGVASHARHSLVNGRKRSQAGEGRR